MNAGYDLRVGVGPDQIVVEIAEVEFDVRRIVVRQVVDLRDSLVREALIALGWTPPTDPTAG